MKKLLLLLAPLTLGLMIGCSYDDSAILDKIAEMEKEHDEMQAQIDAQQTLLDALANKLTITAVTQTDNGYTITFSDGASATIKNGKDGDSFFAEVVVGTTDVTFTLADGTVIVIPLGSGSGEPSAENNKIYYTTSDNTKLFPKTDASLYGAILISNTYKDGQGILVFDDAVTKIGGYAFSNCTSLASITIPDSVTSIGYSAFSDCSSLTSITIPDSVTSIGEHAFSSCSSLTSVIMGSGVTSIGEYAFFGCSSLTSITIPDSVTEIGNAAFSDCTSLTSVTIGNGVTSIGDYAFSNCTSLTSVTIGSGVTSIGNYAFKGCFFTKETFINNSSLDAETNNYWGASIYDIIQEDGLCINGTIAVDCKPDATSITIPDSVTSIGDYAFEDCTSLTSITIPDSVTSIGYFAFYECSSLTSITIPDSVTSIRNNAFRDCTSLKEVYCKPTTPPSAENHIFYNNASGRKIYVPTESVDAYKAARWWSDYADDIVGYDF